MVKRMVDRERQVDQILRRYQPRIEIYVQDVRPDRELGSVPTRDYYNIGWLDLKSGVIDHSFNKKSKWTDNLFGFHMHYVANGFAQMIFPDDGGFDPSHYIFNYVGKEFLGDVRCVMFEVTPRKNSGKGRFLGRVWAEDQNFNIVRFKGTYAPNTWMKFYFHFDSWRVNARPGLWLPAYIYSEESDLKTLLQQKARFKGEVRLWGYDLRAGGREEEETSIMVENPDVRDRAEAEKNYSPLEAQRAWEQEAEDNLLERLQKAGLLAPPGDADKIVETVANNLIITNKLNLPEDVHARILLTTPLETLTIGHTIVISRGLFDVLPDEPSLATFVAHELAHIVLGHRVDTKYAFNDRMIFPDEETFHRFALGRNEHDEMAADQKAMELLRNSPYSKQLGRAGLFLAQMQQRADELPNLMRAHLGDKLVMDNKVAVMKQLMQSAPQLQMTNIHQIAAQPLGSRLKINPWNDRLEVIKVAPLPITSPVDKMPFEVTPLRPYLTRYGVLQAQTQPRPPASAPARNQAPAASAPARNRVPTTQQPAAATPASAARPTPPQPR
jgi:hypothetical protein